MRMRYELRWPEIVHTYIGGHAVSSAPQSAIPFRREPRHINTSPYFIIPQIPSVTDSTSSPSAFSISSVSPESPYLLTPKRATLPLYP